VEKDKQVHDISPQCSFPIGNCSNRSTRSRIRSVLGKAATVQSSTSVAGSLGAVPRPVPCPGEQHIGGPDPIRSPPGCAWGQRQLWCRDTDLHILRQGRRGGYCLGGKDD